MLEDRLPPGVNPQDGNVGNLGDILKHAALVAAAQTMAARYPGQAINYLDTHAYRVEARLANPRWARDVGRLAANRPAYGAYQAREQTWVVRGRYLCSTGLVLACLTSARLHLSEADAEARRALRAGLRGHRCAPATVLPAARAWSAPGRVWARRPLLALVDPFRLTPAAWHDACAALARLHAPGEGGVALVFDYARVAPARWPPPPTGWQGPLASIERLPYRLAAYGTGPFVVGGLAGALVALGWSPGDGPSLPGG